MSVARSLAAGQSLQAAVRALFVNGEQGAWYDPSDLSTVFKDVAGTTPATADGDPVGKILDKSGNGFDAVAAADNTTRPTLKQSGSLWYLSFDGNDTLATSSINFGGATDVSLWSGFTKNTSGGYQTLVSQDADIPSTNYSFGLHATWGGTETTATMRSTTYSSSVVGSANTGAPFTSVVSVKYDFGSATQTAVIRSNGAAYKTLSLAGTAGTVSKQVLRLGARLGIYYFNGRLYSLIVRGAASSDSQISAAERYVARKTGITL